MLPLGNQPTTATLHKEIYAMQLPVFYLNISPGAMLAASFAEFIEQRQASFRYSLETIQPPTYHQLRLPGF